MRRFVASGFSLGLIPQRLWGNDQGAGTFGAAVAAGLSLLLWRYQWWVGAIAFVVALALSLWSAAPFATRNEDPGWVTIDEVAGTLLALIGLSGWPWLVALVVARAADIKWVLPGVNTAEALPVGFGVTMDAVVAGGHGLDAVWFVAWLL